MENEEPGQCLRCGFHSPAQCSLRSTVRHENYIFRFEHRVWGFPRQDLSQVNRRLLPLTTLLIGADDSRPGLRGGTSEALAQGQRLQNGNLFIRFQSESARPSERESTSSSVLLPRIWNTPGRLTAAITETGWLCISCTKTLT